MNNVFYIICSFVFLFTGALQFIGLSITIFSYTLIMMILCILISYFLIRRHVTINSYVIINLCLLLWIVISGIVNQTNILLILNYFSYSIIPLSVYFFVRSLNLNSINLSFAINILVLIQLPVLCVQYFFPEYIIYSQKFINPIDRLFGTFPLSADHFLSFFLIMNILYVGLKASSLTLVNYFIIIYSIVCISLTNSTTSYLLLAATLLYIFFIRSSLYLRIYSIFISIIFLVFLYFNIYEVFSLLNKPELLEMTNTKHIAQGSAGRIQTFFYILTNKLSIFGNGPSSYFNPLKSGFQLNLNFSQLLWFYYDLGVMGVVLLISLIYSFLVSFSFSNHLRVYLFFLIFAYSFSSTIFDQLSFLLILNIFVSILAQRTLNINK